MAFSKIIKRAALSVATLALAAGLAVWGSYAWVERQSAPFLFDEMEKLPQNKVGVVLGTSSRVAGGWENLYFKYRIEAAAALYKSGKVSFLIVSGDNSLSYYNEPKDMAKALAAQGVPDSVIFRDYAGFRTLDSVVRAKAIFGQQSFTVISQPFHTARAVYIARQKGLDAIGFNARDVGSDYGMKTMLREYLARVKTMLDLYVFDAGPKFYGEQINIP